MLERLKGWFSGRSPQSGYDEARPRRETDQEGAQKAPHEAAHEAVREAAYEAVCAARDAAWKSVGVLDDDVIAPFIDPGLMGGPMWPGTRQAFVRTRRDDGIGIVASDGLADPFHGDGPSTGLGAEVYLASTAFDHGVITGASSTRQFTALSSLARAVAGNESFLGPMLETYGTISMTLRGSDGAPEGWLDDDGAISVIIGVNLLGVPASVAVQGIEVLLVGVLPLRPDELALIPDEGAPARRRIADALRGLTAAQVASLERPSVLPLG